MGRIILIQETFSDSTGGPQTAEYKKRLADTHCLIRQLELDFGDQPKRILDWSGSVVAVLLHGADLLRLHLGTKPFGGLMLGVPNEKYDSWMLRLDLTKLAIHGADADTPQGEEILREKQPPTQEDAVRVTLRRKKKSTGTGQ